MAIAWLREGGGLKGPDHNIWNWRPCRALGGPVSPNSGCARFRRPVFSASQNTLLDPPRIPEPGPLVFKIWPPATGTAILQLLLTCWAAMLRT